MASFGSYVVWLIVGLQTKGIAARRAEYLGTFRGAVLHFESITAKLSDSGVVNIRDVVV